MTGPHPAVAAVRLAVRRDLPIIADGGGVSWSPEIPEGGCVLVACSGGADSLALLAATIFEARKVPFRVIGVTVDHGLQEGSAAHATRVVDQMAAMGADETASIRVTVDPGPQGIEAGAREARYAALSQLAEHFGAEYVLLGHTLDDQAETVLLGLTHGSGIRSLQGMRAGFRRDEGEVAPVIWGKRQEGDQTFYFGHEEYRHSTYFTRPLLRITREQTRAACTAEGIEWWADPHNDDPRFVRSRIRHTVLPMLEEQLGPGIAETLARTADQARMDVDFIDGHVERWFEEHPDGIDLEELDESVGAALATRVLRRAAIEAGALASELTWQHVQALWSLDEGDTRQIQLPGHVTAHVEGRFLRFRRT